MPNHDPRKRQPRLDRASVRQKRIAVRFTDLELARVNEVSAIAHLPVATVMRSAILGLDISPPVPAINFRTYGELQQQGKNLNQLLIAVHRGQVPQELHGTTLELLRLYREIIGTITRRPAAGEKRA